MPTGCLIRLKARLCGLSADDFRALRPRPFRERGGRRGQTRTGLAVRIDAPNILAWQPETALEMRCGAPPAEAGAIRRDVGLTFACI